VESEAQTLAPLGGRYAPEVTECVRAGGTESAVMPLDDTLAVMAVLEQAAAQLGVSWAEDAAVPVYARRLGDLVPCHFARRFVVFRAGGAVVAGYTRSGR
jgi:hypothetical protein